MTIGIGTVVWFNSADGTAEGTDIAANVTVGSGESLIVFGTGTSNGQTLSISGGGLTYTPVGSVVDDTGNKQQVQCWKVENPGAGTYTVTIAVTGGAFPYVEGCAVPITGAKTSSIVVAFGNGTLGGQYQATPGTGTDALTSGTAQTPSATPALVLCLSFCTSGGAAKPNVGTGFTDGGSGWHFELANDLARLEHKRITSGTAQALFTALGNTAHVTMMVAIEEASASGVTATIAADTTADFSAAATATQTDPATGAAVITDDFVAAATATETITATGAASIAGDFTPAATTTAVPTGMLLSTSGHHLVAGGAPKFLLLDSAWSIAVELNRAQVDDYLDTRLAQGFDGIIWEMIESGTYGGPNNAYGDAPFLVANDLTTPNPAYWAHVDYIQGALAARGMWSFPNGLYLGFGGGAEGWFSVVGSSEATTYGQFLGQRYKDHSHTVWGNYGDYLPSPTTIPAAFRDGIDDFASQLILNHLARNSTGTDAGDSPTLNSSYTDDDNVFTRVSADYAASPTLPTGLYEAQYQGTFGGGPTRTALDVRRQCWHAACAGATYVAGGTHKVWQFLSGWETTGGGIDDDYGATIAPLPDLWNAIAWYDLVPQASGAIIASGEGSAETYVSVAKNSAGSLCVVYIPDGSGSTVTVKLGSLASSLRTRWYDPTNGTYSTAGAGTYSGAGNTVFTKPSANNAGDNDWVLLIEEQTNATIAAAITGDFSAAAASTVANPVTATAAASIEADLAAASSATETIPATAAALVTSDFAAAASSTVANPVTSTTAGVVTDDLSAAGTATETIPGTAAVALADDVVASGDVSVANPVDATVASTIAADFVAAATVTHSTDGDLTVSASITADFTAAATGSETIPAAAAASLTDDFAADGSATEAIPATAAASLEGDFTAALTVTHTASGVDAAIAADATADIAASATASLGVPAIAAADVADLFTASCLVLATVPVSASVAADVSAEFLAAISMRSGAVFAAPTARNPRVARIPRR